MKQIKRRIAGILTVLMMALIIPTTAMAAEAEDVYKRQMFYRQKASRVVVHPEKYRCSRCGGKFEVVSV